VTVIQNDYSKSITGPRTKRPKLGF